MKKKVKAFVKQVGAALTSPAVVKVEEKAAVFVAVRLVTQLGGSAAAIAGVYELAKALGWA